MKEKFKAWADAIREIRFLTMPRNEAIELSEQGADFLQRMADMPDDEPDDGASDEWQPSIPMVTKASLDWWIIKFHHEHHARYVAEKELAAAKARIAELEDLYSEPHEPFKNKPIECKHESATLMCNECGINFRNGKIDQPRPLLKDQPEVFERLMFGMRVAPNLGNEKWILLRNELRKLLVGE